ncbi:hypothetical protein E3T43_09985 [Cryobacterium sp. Hh7]|nr:hypothetical protein E3T43_09985 [Cryobacterium sp. Hh7]
MSNEMSFSRIVVWTASDCRLIAVKVFQVTYPLPPVNCVAEGKMLEQSRHEHLQHVERRLATDMVG